MFKVTKQEAEFIRQHSKNVRITLTGKHKKSKRKRCYVDESAETFMLLEQYWNGINVKPYLPSNFADGGYVQS